MKRKILIKFASRERPDKFLKGVKNIFDTCDNPKEIMVIASFDRDDATRDDAQIWEAFDYCFSKGGFMRICVGEPKGNIDAINRDIHVNGWDVLINFSDDFVFTRIGWDSIILGHAAQYGSTDFCFHYSDGYRADIITMAVIGSRYYRRFNYIYFPHYKTFRCKHELTVVSRLLCCYRYSEQLLFKYVSPDNVEESKDDEHEYDNEIYETRKRSDFFLQS
jgi:hypothetical protein